MTHDIAIIGGGPAGLAAARTLGRARKRVVVLDGGPRRNAAATHMQNFVTRDGTPPLEFRRVAREQLASYPNVELRDGHVDAIRGERGAFELGVGGATVRAARILVATGMIDDLPDLPGLREIWGTSAMICPYCHGWEVQDRRFAYLATHAAKLEFAILLGAWSPDVVVLTNGALDVPPEVRAKLAAANVTIEPRRITRLVHEGPQLGAIELADGTRLARDVMFLHPPQRQIDLVGSLGLALDEHGFVKVDPMTRETSVKGLYAAGDLITGMQTAITAAAAGTHAAGMINHELTIERALHSATPRA